MPHVNPSLAVLLFLFSFRFRFRCRFRRRISVPVVFTFVLSSGFECFLSRSVLVLLFSFLFSFSVLVFVLRFLFIYIDCPSLSLYFLLFVRRPIFASFLSFVSCCSSVLDMIFCPVPRRARGKKQNKTKQVEPELLDVISYLLQHGAKPGTLGLIRLSTSVQYPLLKVGPIFSHLPCRKINRGSEHRPLYAAASDAGRPQQRRVV